MRAWIHSEDGANEVSRLIHRALCPCREGDDLFQDVWCDLISNWPRIVASYDLARGAWTAYLRGVIRNTARKRTWRLTHNPPPLLFLPDLDLTLVDGRSTAEGVYARAEESCQALEYAFATLAARVDSMNFEILERRLKRRQTVSEIAAALKIPTTTVYKRLGRMKRKLKDIVVAWVRTREESALQDLLNRKKPGGV